MKIDKFGKTVILLWMAGFIVSAIIQLAVERPFAAQTIWGYTPGWQREIGLWNIGLILVLSGLLRSGIDFARYVIPGITILGACFGLNHLIAAIYSPGSLGHWAGFGANSTGILCSFAYYLRKSKESKSTFGESLCVAQLCVIRNL
jgi:hypothetical protein